MRSPPILSPSPYRGSSWGGEGAWVTTCYYLVTTGRGSISATSSRHEQFHIPIYIIFSMMYTVLQICGNVEWCFGNKTFLVSFVPLFSLCLLSLSLLKGHGNEADFLGALHKSVRHRSLTLHFEPFRFWLRIRGDIRNQKRLPDSPSRGVDKNAYRYKCFQTFESINGVSTLQPRLIFG